MSGKLSALEFFTQLDHDNIGSIGVLDDKGNVIDLFSNTDIKYWLKSQNSVSLDENLIDFMRLTKRQNLYYDGTKFI